MRPGRYHITIYQGSTFVLPLRFQQPSGSPVDMTGCAIRGQIRRTARATEAINLTAEITSAADGLAEVRLTAAQTAAMQAGNSAGSAAGQYVYDIEVVWADGTISRVMEGRLTISPEVTKSISDPEEE